MLPVIVRDRRRARDRALQAAFIKLSLGDPNAIRQGIVELVRKHFDLSRVNILIHNRTTNMLEASGSIGQPQYDHRDIRTPLLRLEGLSSRAVLARSFLDNTPIIVDDRTPDPEYRLRERMPHKSYSREFAAFPLVHRSRKLGLLSIAVDQDNPTRIAYVASTIETFLPVISGLLVLTFPKTQPDRKMASAVKKVIQDRLIYPVFQPIVDMKTNTAHGFESLMRLKHALFPGPLSLLNYAEKFNALRDISWLSHSTAADHLGNLEPKQKIFFNLHPRDFVEYSHIDSPSNPFYQKDLSKIVFEITERSYIHDPQGLKSILDFFRSLGVGIAIDDLGSGYSSLEMLTSLEPDYVKLDMSLIRGIDRNERKQKLVKSLLYYCRQIGSLCIAEGVETKEELDVLVNLKCRFIQGFYFFKPHETLVRNVDIKKRCLENARTP